MNVSPLDESENNNYPICELNQETHNDDTINHLNDTKPEQNAYLGDVDEEEDNINKEKETQHMCIKRKRAAEDELERNESDHVNNSTHEELEDIKRMLCVISSKIDENSSDIKKLIETVVTNYETDDDDSDESSGSEDIMLELNRKYYENIYHVCKRIRQSIYSFF